MFVPINKWLQHVELLAPLEKHRRLEHILRSQEPGSKIIVFCSTKKMCDQLARNLTRHFGAAAIHGDKSQGERDYVLSQFRTGRTPILVATDVAARGLDIKDIRFFTAHIFVISFYFGYINTLSLLLLKILCVRYMMLINCLSETSANDKGLPVS